MPNCTCSHKHTSHLLSHDRNRRGACTECDCTSYQDRSKVTVETLIGQFEKMHAAYVLHEEKDFKREAMKLGQDLRGLRAELTEIAELRITNECCKDTLRDFIKDLLEKKETTPKETTIK